MIFQNNNITIRLDTDIDLNSATNPIIRYEKPNRERGEWDAVIENDEFLTYQTEDDDLDLHGAWKFQAQVEINEKTISGDIVTQQIDKAV